MKEYNMNDLIKDVKQFEGFRCTAYQCPAGYWTVGYGHRASRNMTLSEKTATTVLKQDLMAAIKEVEAIAILPTARQDFALADIVFNIGTTAFKKSPKLLAAIKAYESAPTDENSNAVVERIKAFKYATVGGTKKVLAGLVKRREWEANLWNEGHKFYREQTT